MTTTLPLLKAPDIENGSVIPDHDGHTPWLTEISAVLSVKKKGEAPKFAYLAHECRAEKVLAFQKNPETPLLFAPYECIVLKTWEQNYAFRFGAYTYPLNLFSKRRKVEAIYPKSVKADCPVRDVTTLSFKEVLEEMQKENLRARKLFIRVAWESQGHLFQLYLPSRYTNYPHPKLLKEHRYLQPISGYAIYYDLNHFYTAYVVAYLSETAPPKIEFTLRVSTSFFKTKAPGRASKIMKAFTALPGVRRLFVTDEFVKNISVEGSCDFYIYDKSAYKTAPNKT